LRSRKLDDIAGHREWRNELQSEGAEQDFAKGVELLADNELHPALPPDAFRIVRDQAGATRRRYTCQPAYRTNRARESALLPERRPGAREATPQSVSALALVDIKAYYTTVFAPI